MTVNCGFNVKIESSGIGPEHYEKIQRWDANQQSIRHISRLERPEWTALKPPKNILEQDSDDDGWSWIPATEAKLDFQNCQPHGHPWAGAPGGVIYGYSHTDRHFTVRYRNKTTGAVGVFEHDWGWGWNNHNLKAGKWWTEDTGQGDLLWTSVNLLGLPW